MRRKNSKYFVDNYLIIDSNLLKVGFIEASCRILMNNYSKNEKYIFLSIISVRRHSDG